MQLNLKDGSFSFGDNTIFSSADLTVNEGEHIALVGKNGCGKTTLLKVLTGELELDGGSLSLSGFKPSFLSQIRTEESQSLETYLKSAYSEICLIEERLLFLSENMEENERLISEFSRLTERFRNIGGYSYKAEYSSALTSFGFSQDDLNKDINAFSGGEKTKIALLHLLLSRPSLLLLDEPTNNLDIDAVNWLESFLSSYKGAFLLVSHDREFLDKTVNVVYEMERGSLKRYKGNYSAFYAMKQQKYQEDLKRYKSDKAEEERLRALIERFRYKATKASFAQSKIKKLERMGEIEKPQESDTATFHGSFQPEYESGEEVLFVKELKVGYSKTLSTLSFRVCKGDKLAILGGNGLGKSTLLKTIMRLIPPLGGEMRFGHQIKLAYFSQDSADRLQENTVLDEMMTAFPRLSPSELRSILGAFLFRGDEVFREISSLSGGERVRLTLCKILTSKPNLLILDEPTNHLDIPSKEALENILAEFSGTVILVSHDRFFVKRVANKVLYLENGKGSYFEGGYSQFLNRPSIAPASAVSVPKEKKELPLNRLKEASRIKRRISTLERLISECEGRIAALKEQLNAVSYDYLELQRINGELEKEDGIYNELFSEISEKYEILEGLE